MKDMAMTMSAQSVLRIVPRAFLSGADGAGVLNVPGQAAAPLSVLEALVLQAFAVPRTLENGVAEIRARSGALALEEPLATVCDLVDRGAIAFYEVADNPRNPGRALGMFGCPRIDAIEALAGDVADLVFVGMPYELGVTGGKGTSGGPAYLRRCSRIAFDYVERDGVPAGWWDTLSSTRVLEGVRFADAGDVSCQGTVRNGIAFDRLYEMVGAILDANALPVVIGGDHSIAYPAIRAVADRRERIGVIQFDAHPDLGRTRADGSWRRNLTHGNFMSWIEARPEIASLTQLGTRHLLPEPHYPTDKLVAHHGTAWVDRLDRVLDGLDTSYPYYLTFDVDCLDPSILSQTGTPVPGGLDYHQAAAALRAICGHVEIVGIDVVELRPGRFDWEAHEGTTIAYLLFAVLSAIFKRRATLG